MQHAHALIVRRSVILWGVTGAVITFNLLAALLQDPAMTNAALLLTGITAVGGIGFGLWAGLILAKDARAAR